LIEVNSILPLCLWESHEERQVWAVAVSNAGQLYRASAAVGARNGRAAATVSLASSSVARLALDWLAKGRDGLIVKFFFHDARQLFFHVILQEFNEWIKTDFLVHDRHAALRLIAGHDQCWKEDLFELLITEIWKRQIAQLLQDGILSSLQNLLGLFVEQAIVANEHECLVQELFRVFVSVIVFMCVYKQIVQQVEELVLQHFVFEKELLHEMDVHANGIV